MVEFFFLEDGQNVLSRGMQGVMTADNQFVSAWVARNVSSNGHFTRASETNCIYVITSDSGGDVDTQVQASRSSLDSDGFTINVSTASGSRDIVYKAYA